MKNYMKLSSKKNNKYSRKRHVIFLYFLKFFIYSSNLAIITVTLVIFIGNYMLASFAPIQTVLEVLNNKDVAVSPNIKGSLPDGSSYKISATTAYNQVFNSDYITFNLPRIEYTINNKTIYFASQLASFYNTSKIMYLNNNVFVKYEGLQLKTSELFADTKLQTLDIRGLVEITGRGLYLVSYGMVGNLKDQVVTFKGPIDIVYNQPKEPQKGK